MTEWPKARDTQTTRGEHKKMTTEGSVVMKEMGEDLTMLRAHGEIPIKKKRQEMQIRKNQ